MRQREIEELLLPWTDARLISCYKMADYLSLASFAIS
jgi:hypothetical protein